MRFPLAEQLALECRLAQVIPGRIHSDGKRYLPLLMFELHQQPQPQIALVDRHHQVDLRCEGQNGQLQAIFLLSRIQRGVSGQKGLEDQQALAAQRASSAPTVFGQVLEIATWEESQHALPSQSLFIELLLDIGVGKVGVRTHTTVADITAAFGKPQIETGDWITLTRSRIDILAFKPQS
jgi:hypothetical protein